MVSRDKLDRKGPISVNILNMIFFYLLSIEIKEPPKLDEKLLYSLQTYEISIMDSFRPF